jgi:hypothetical protein
MLLAETDAFLTELDEKEFRFKWVKALPNSSASWELYKPIYYYVPPEYAFSPWAGKFMLGKLGQLRLRTRPNGLTLLELTEVPTPTFAEAQKFAIYVRRHELSSDWQITFSHAELMDDEDAVRDVPPFRPIKTLAGISELSGQAQQSRVEEFLEMVKYFESQMHLFLQSELQKFADRYLEYLRSVTPDATVLETVNLSVVINNNIVKIGSQSQVGNVIAGDNNTQTND